MALWHHQAPKDLHLPQCMVSGTLQRCVWKHYVQAGGKCSIYLRQLLRFKCQAMSLTCAKSEMPIVAVSPSTFTHSWDSLYLRPCSTASRHQCQTTKHDKLYIGSQQSNLSVAQWTCGVHGGGIGLLDRMRHALPGIRLSMQWPRCLGCICTSSPVANPRPKTDLRAILTLLPVWQAVGLAQQRPARLAAVAAS